MAKKELKHNKQMDFDGQREGEKVLFVFRRHIIAMRKGFYLFLGTFLIASLPALIIGPSSSYETMLTLLKIDWNSDSIIGLLLFIYHFILWYFSIYYS